MKIIAFEEHYTLPAIADAHPNSPRKLFDASRGGSGWPPPGIEDLGEGRIAAMDAAGNVQLRGRTKELINRGGIKINPSDLEAAIAAHPSVADVAIAMSGSAVFSATIEEITSSTPKHATVSNQSRARSDKPARAKSLSWPG